MRLPYLPRPVLFFVLGLITPVVLLAIFWVKNLPELSVWHTHLPAGDYHAERSDIQRFAQYQQLEKQLLADVESQIIARTPADQQRLINRYAKTSLTNPLNYPQNWNLSYQLQGKAGGDAVLLVHGLSDSPYSLRVLALQLHAAGYTVLGLRLPSHGTAPAALTTFKWQDAAAAVRLAMRDLAINHSKIHYIGYSTGATLGCEYQLARMGGEPLPAIQSMTLISPAIAVTSAAKYAQWASYLAPLSGVGAAAWSEISPEYNPYKYNSFPFNAAVQMREFTLHLHQQLIARAPLRDWPPTNVFLSAVDNTVVAEPVVTLLMSQLPPNRHQLMLFDLNRYAEYSPLLNPSAADWALKLADSRQPRPYRLQFVSNRLQNQGAVVSIEDTPAGATQATVRPTNYQWPNGIFALSHIALPFSPQDPLFGDPAQQPNDHTLKLNQSLIGERGLLQISGNEILRLRYNPFYALQEQEIMQFIAQSH